MWTKNNHPKIVLSWGLSGESTLQSTTFRQKHVESTTWGYENSIFTSPHMKQVVPSGAFINWPCNNVAITGLLASVPFFHEIDTFRSATIRVPPRYWKCPLPPVGGCKNTSSPFAIIRHLRKFCVNKKLWLSEHKMKDARACIFTDEDVDIDIISCMDGEDDTNLSELKSPLHTLGHFYNFSRMIFCDRQRLWSCASAQEQGASPAPPSS